MPDPATLQHVSDQLDELIPEARRWRRQRWVAWLALGLAGAVLVLGGVGWWVYLEDEREDCDARIERHADLREAFDVLIQVAVDPNDPEAVAAGEELDAALAEALPPPTC